MVHIKTTRKQRESIAKLWGRLDEETRPTYLNFRKTVQGTFKMDGAVVVPYCGMFVAIEADGYSHS